MKSKQIIPVVGILTALFFQPLETFAADSDATSAVPTPEAIKAAVPAKAGLENVVIVYKTHFDIGYTARARDVVHEYRTEMADRVLDAIEKNSRQPKDKQFVWTLSGWPMKQILWNGQTPERRQEIEQAIRDGNLVMHAYPFTTHTETAELEDLVRGLNISSTINRTFGLPLSTSAKMSDVPGQSWIFPTLFAHAGIKFYHMGGPLVNKTLGLPPFFWWEGPDGSRLLTLYNNGYGSSTLPPADWPYKTWIHISMTGDNQGPPAPETVKNDLAFYAQRGIKARVGKMDDFAELILNRERLFQGCVRSEARPHREPDRQTHGPRTRRCDRAAGLRPVFLRTLCPLESRGVDRGVALSAIRCAQVDLLRLRHAGQQHVRVGPAGKHEPRDSENFDGCLRGDDRHHGRPRPAAADFHPSHAARNAAGGRSRSRMGQAA